MALPQLGLTPFQELTEEQKRKHIPVDVNRFRTENQVAQGIKRGFYNQGGSMVASLGGLAGELALPGVKDSLLETAESMQETALDYPARIGQVEKVRGIGDALSYAGGVVGEQIPQVAASVVLSALTRGAVKGAGLKSLAKSVAAKPVSVSKFGLMREATKNIAKRQKTLGTAAFATPGVLMNTGEAYQERRELGDDSYIRSLPTGGGSSLLDILPQMRVFNKILGGGRSKVIGDIMSNAKFGVKAAGASAASKAANKALAKAAGGELAKTMGIEGVTEELQQELLIQQRMELDPDYQPFSAAANSERLNSFVAGAIVGSGMSIGSITADAARGRAAFNQRMGIAEVAEIAKESAADKKVVDADKIILADGTQASRKDFDDFIKEAKANQDLAEKGGDPKRADQFKTSVDILEDQLKTSSPFNDATPEQQEASAKLTEERQAEQEKAAEEAVPVEPVAAPSVEPVVTPPVDSTVDPDVVDGGSLESRVTAMTNSAEFGKKFVDNVLDANEGKSDKEKFEALVTAAKGKRDAEVVSRDDAIKDAEQASKATPFETTQKQSDQHRRLIDKLRDELVVDNEGKPDARSAEILQEARNQLDGSKDSEANFKSIRDNAVQGLIDYKAEAAPVEASEPVIDEEQVTTKPRGAEPLEPHVVGGFDVQTDAAGENVFIDGKREEIAARLAENNATQQDYEGTYDTNKSRMSIPRRHYDAFVEKLQAKVEPPTERVLPGVKGTTASVVTPDNKITVEAQYQVVPNTELTVSHGTDFAANPNYKGYQPRDRADSRYQVRTAELAAALNPSMLGESALSDTGSPIVDAAGTVLSGNGRMIALNMNYEKGSKQAEKYKNWLINNAQQFGLSRKDIRGVENPVLVRAVADSSVDLQAFAKASNEQATQSYNIVERAFVDAGSMTDALMGGYKGSAVDKNSDFIKGFVRETGASDIQAEGGRLSQAGTDRLIAAILAKTYGSKIAVSELLEQQSTKLKSVLNSLADAAGDWHKMRVVAKQQGIDDITPKLLDTIDKINQAKNSPNLSITGMFAQGDAFTPTDPLAQKLVLLFYNKGKAENTFGRQLSEDKSSEIIKRVARAIVKKEGTADLFADNRTVGDIISEVHDGVAGLKEGQADLLDAKPKHSDNDELNARFDAAVNDVLDILGDVVGHRKKVTGSQRTSDELLPALAKVLGVLMEMGFKSFSDTISRASQSFNSSEAGRALTADITPRKWRGAYNVIAENYPGADSEATVAALTDEQVTALLNPAKEDDSMTPHDTIAKAKRAGTLFNELDAGESDAISSTASEDSVSTAGKEQVDTNVTADVAGEGDQGAGRSTREDGQGGASTRSGASILDSDAVVGGEQGDTEVSDDAGKLPSEGRAPGRGDGRGGSDTRADGVSTDERAGAGSENIVESDSARIGVKATNDVIVGDKDNIAATLPELYPTQHEDVLFAETRLFGKADGRGVLFTNGTGTGKTFVGAGFVKRRVLEGKGNIIITVPGEKVAGNWVKTGKILGVDITRLKDTKDAGKGVVVTTYANFRANNHLLSRDIDFLIHDESQHLMQAQNGVVTANLTMSRMITGHPQAGLAYAEAMESDLLGEIKALKAKVDELKEATFDRGERTFDKRNKIDQEITALRQEFSRRAVEHKKTLAKKWAAKTTRRLDLSATPFAYQKSVEMAEGFLFDYSTEEGQGYNAVNGQEQFMMDHFGYRMRYGKLTQPDSDVDQALMEREFNQWLKDQKVLSARRLDVDKDYSREFVDIDDSIGLKIDEGFQYLQDMGSDKSNPLTGEYYDIYTALMGDFKYHQRIKLLEAIKAPHAIERAKKHIAMGRKVVLFHSRIQGGTPHPFADLKPKSKGDEISFSKSIESYNRALREFKVARADLVNLDIGTERPIDLLKEAFGDTVLFYNGTVSRREKMDNPDIFNDDEAGIDVIALQDDAGKEGITLNDQTGGHQRVLINLGLPLKPTQAIQIEGRIYRLGQMTDAIFEYLTTGSDFERWTFASTIAGRASTAENLALGDEARSLKEAFIDAYDAATTSDPSDSQGLGGKETDRVQYAAVSEFDKAKIHYAASQKQSGNRQQREGDDYFATPEPLGFKLVEWAQAKAKDSFLEPSAGHGAIGRYFPTMHDQKFIEPSERLAAKLALRVNDPDNDIKRSRFEDYHIGNKHSVIVMNPPYGAGGKTAIDHLSKAMHHLSDGGRIIAILPDGPQANKRLEKLLNGRPNEVAEIEETIRKNRSEGKSVAAETKRIDELNNLFLVQEISLPRITFKKAGTSVKTKVVIIDRSNGAEIVGTKNTTISAETIPEFFNEIESIESVARMGVQPRKTTDRRGRITPEIIEQSGEQSRLEVAELEVVEKDGSWYVVGRGTYDHKAMLKKLGAKWSRKETGWRFDHDPTVEVTNALPSGSPKFAKTASPVIEGAYTSAQVKSEIIRLFGKRVAGDLRRGSIKVVDSVAGLPDDLLDTGETLLQAIQSDSSLANIQGLYHNGTVYLVAEMLDSSDLPQVFVHEQLHRALEESPKLRERIEAQANGLRSVFEKLEAGNYVGPYKRFYSKGFALMEAAGTDESLRFEEFLTYTVDQYYSKPASLPGKVREAIKNIISAIKMALFKLGVPVRTLTPRDLTTLAKQAVGKGVTSTNADVKFSRASRIKEEVDHAMSRAGAVGKDLMTDKNWQSALRASLSNARPEVLKWMGRQQLVEVYKHLFPRLMEQYNKIMMQIGAEHNEVMAKAWRTIEKWMKLSRPMNESMIELMDETQAAEMHPDKEFKKNKLIKDLDKSLAIKENMLRGETDPVKLAGLTRDIVGLKNQRRESKLAYKKIKAMYDVLNDDARKVYSEVEKAYFDFRAQQREAISDRIERSKFDEETKDEMIKQHEETFALLKNGPYFPRHRFGDYVLVVSKDGEQDQVMMYETETHRDRDERYWEANGWAIKQRVKSVEYVNNMSSSSSKFVDDLNNLITDEAGASAEEQATAKALIDSVNQLYLKSLPELSIRKHDLHRRLVPGHSKEARRGFAKYMFHGVFNLSKLNHADQLQQLLIDMEDHIKSKVDDTGYEHSAARDVVTVMNQRYSDTLNPQGNIWTNRLNSIGFMWFLGATPAAAMVNISQTVLMTLPMAGAKWGWKNAEKHLMGAANDYLRSHKKVINVNIDDISWLDSDQKLELTEWVSQHNERKGFSIANVLTDSGEMMALKSAESDGTIDTTISHDFAGLSQSDKELMGDARRNTMEVMSFMFHHAEVFNRQVTFIAGYRMSMERSAERHADWSFEKRHNRAVAEAKNLVVKSHFDYTSENRPIRMSGNFARVAFMFKQFSQNMIYQMARNTYVWLSDSDAVDLDGKPLTDKAKIARKKEARNTLAGILGMHGLMAGTMGLPMFTTVMAILNAVFDDDPDDPWDAEIAWRNFLADHLGQSLGEVIAKGAPRAVLPLDVAGRLSLDGMIVQSDRVKDLEGQDWYDGMLSQAMGPMFGSMIPGLFRGSQLISEGETWKGLEQFMPKFLRDLSKTARYSQDGIVDSRGNVIVDELTPFELTGQAIGFSSVAGSEKFSAKRAIKTKQWKVNRRRSLLLRQLNMAKQRGDDAWIKEILANMDVFSKTNPEIAITAKTRRKSEKSRKANSGLDSFGINVPENRKDLMRVGRFTLGK